MTTVQTIHPIRVLLASRDPRFLAVTGFLLSREGFVVESTRGESNLLETVRRRQANVVVLDMGSSAARTAGAIEKAEPLVRVLLVAEEVASSAEPGELLHKWGPIEDLVDRLRRVCADTLESGSVAAGSFQAARSHSH